MKNFLKLVLLALIVVVVPAMAESISFEQAQNLPTCEVIDHRSGPLSGKGLYSDWVAVKMSPSHPRNGALCVMNGKDVVKRKGKLYHRVCHNRITKIRTIHAQKQQQAVQQQSSDYYRPDSRIVTKEVKNENFQGFVEITKSVASGSLGDYLQGREYKKGLIGAAKHRRPDVTNINNSLSQYQTATSSSTMATDTTGETGGTSVNNTRNTDTGGTSADNTRNTDTGGTSVNYSSGDRESSTGAGS